MSHYRKPYQRKDGTHVKGHEVDRKSAAKTPDVPAFTPSVDVTHDPLSGAQQKPSWVDTSANVTDLEHQRIVVKMNEEGLERFNRTQQESLDRHTQEIAKLSEQEREAEREMQRLRHDPNARPEQMERARAKKSEAMSWRQRHEGFRGTIQRQQGQNEGAYVMVQNSRDRLNDMEVLDRVDLPTSASRMQVNSDTVESDVRRTSDGATNVWYVPSDSEQAFQVESFGPKNDTAIVGGQLCDPNKGSFFVVDTDDGEPYMTSRSTKVSV